MFYTSDSFSDPHLAKKFQIRIHKLLPDLVGSLCGGTPAVVHELSRHLLRKKLAAAATEAAWAVYQP